MRHLAQSLASTFGVDISYPDNAGKRCVLQPRSWETPAQAERRIARQRDQRRQQQREAKRGVK